MGLAGIRNKARNCLIMGRPRTPPEERFWAKVDRTGDCWLWRGAKSSAGYGYFRPYPDTQMRAHRYSWILSHGHIDDDELILHKCDVPLCVRPDHLFTGSQHENVHDCIEKGRFVTGTKNGMSKLTDGDVQRVRDLLAAGKSQSEIGRLFGVSQTAIWSIAHERCWPAGPRLR